MTDIARFADPDPVRFQADTKDVRFAKFSRRNHRSRRRTRFQLLQQRTGTAPPRFASRSARKKTPLLRPEGRLAKTLCLDIFSVDLE